MSVYGALSIIAALALPALAAPLAPRDLSCGQQWQQGGASWSIECNDRLAGDMPSPNGLWAATIYDCIGQCTVRDGCILVDYVPYTKLCYLKSTVGEVVANGGVMGAVKVTDSSPSSVSNGGNAGYIAPSPSPAPYTAPSSPAPMSGGGKRGLAFNDASLTNAFGGSGSKVSWGYDWSQTAGSGFNTGVKYIPMLWGGDATRLGTWKSNADAGIAAGADALLGFNEPDHPQQANMAVSQAVADWQSSMQPYAGKVALISPAVTNGPAPMGLTYLKNFVSQCNGCQIDACAVHWYDSATNIQYFKNYMTDAIAACGGKPIWLTEFGATGSTSEIATFLNTVLPWMDSNAGIERYAYFMTAKGGDYLLDNSGALSQLGQIYNSA